MTNLCPHHLRLLLGGLLLLLTLAALPARADTGLLEPFAVRNQNPLVQGYGLPVWYANSRLAAGEWEGLFTADVASHYSRHYNAREDILFDGETDRFALALRRGLAGGGEFSLEVPWLTHRGGNLDHFINSWHNALGLSQSGRSKVPDDELHFVYRRDGATLVDLQQRTSGFGDVALGTSWPLRHPADATDYTLTLGTRLELPTGDSSDLLGSGSTDLALWLAARTGPGYSDGRLAASLALGALAMTRSKILPEQQRRLVGFARLLLGWSATDWIAFKLQVDAHSAFYNSDLDELGATAVLLTLGGSLALPADMVLDLGVVEDLVPATAPDVAFHLALRRHF